MEKNSFVVQGFPADVDDGNESRVVENLLEAYKNSETGIKFSKREILVRAAAKQQSIKAGVKLTDREMHSITEQLFQCTQPNVTPDGYPTYLEFKQEQLQKLFGK